MKKVLSLAFIALFTLTTVTFTGCKKYEDGPTLSLRSKKARVAGKWKVEKELYNNTDITSTATANSSGSYSELDKDGTFKSVSGSVTFSGTWAFSSDKKSIVTTFSSISSTSTILKLKNKELWLKYTDTAGNTTETHYVPF